MRKVYLLPNAFTAASLFCGVFAIFETYDGAPRNAVWLILAAGLLDVLDGAIARLTRSTSAFGIHFDSIADIVSFGVAPALLAYTTFTDARFAILAAAVCSLYAVCGALRLARFNVQATREERKAFVGLPIPAAALAAVSIVWLFLTNPELHAYLPLDKLLPPALVILAYLMVSKIPFHGLKSLPLAERQPFEILVTLVVIGCLLVMLKRHLNVVTFAVSWGYVLAGVAAALTARRRSRAVVASRRSGEPEARAAAGSRSDS